MRKLSSDDDVGDKVLPLADVIMAVTSLSLNDVTLSAMTSDVTAAAAADTVTEHIRSCTHCNAPALVIHSSHANQKAASQ